MTEKECDGPNQVSDSPREIKLPGVDFISSLPDAILHHILSYIPTKFAIRTSVLSKRWKCVWYATPSISIDCNREDHLSLINQTLTRYSSFKITSFDVSIRFGITTTYVDRWINLPMSQNSDNLSLVLETYYSFPDFFYKNSSVKHLTLTLGLGLFPDLIPYCTVSWTSLRNLSLNRCNIPDESIANILSGCPMLQSLILNHCAKIHRLDLSRSVNLTTLEIISGRLLGPAEIVAPYIHYLRLTNFHKPPTLVDVSSLTEANLNLGYSRYRIPEADFLQNMMLKVLNMLAKVQNIENLTIGTVALQILSLADLHGIPFPEIKIKALTIETMVVRSVIPGIIRLLQSSPEVKKITLYTIKCKAIVDEVFNGYLDTQGLNNNRSWSGFFPTVEEIRSSFNNIAKDEKSEHVALFMDFVLWNAKTIETMVLRLGSYLNAIECQNMLSKVPKVSRNTNFRKDGQGKAILNSFKIIP